METRNKQLRYLAQSIRLKEAASPRLVRATMTVTSLSILAFLGWAAVTDVHEIAHTPGDVVPSGYQQVVQHLEGGMVSEILVHEGEEVAAGQVLMRLDGTAAEADLRRLEDRALILGMQEERLRAFLEKREPRFSEAAKARPDLLRDQEAFFAGMSDAKKKEMSVINEQIAQKKQTIGMLAADLDMARSNLAIAEDLYARRSELHRKGLVPEVKLMETEQNRNQLRGQIRNISAQIAVARSAIAEYQNRLASLSADNVDTSNQKLDAVIAAMQENEETIKKLKDRVARLDIKSPVRGVVKGLAVNTIGSVVQPGQVLMEIVPMDAPLVVDLKIPPRYIGHVKPGQDVQVKFSSFDFSRYGSVAGRLDFISAATFNGQNGERYYQGRVRLARDYVGNDEKNVIMPGMTVMADVITGRKTILEYLLKPIRNALSTAFTER